ncbi:hypothetical protein [Streptomyces aurantiogriseus]|uniref:Secreted protein n=1 Tax=Streptomyces aurantiogriseus TaxID=66870 RepID=A0A918FKB2_9ACTN|nr:hypothetical protein [Streptomyces aurantiogriseus]GGR45431.1 hypothetical protein GCM10010251_73110 [Streptomyces aurantiogriseus]
MATLVALAVGGLASANCGLALADDPGAAATGGSSTAGDLFQQNTAQESKQNNNCSHENSSGLPELTDSRRDVRCVTDDASWNKHDLVEDGGARAEGGSSTADVVQQNTAQEGRQNNNCANPNSSPVTAGGGQQESGCVNRDVSRNKHTVVKGGGARAEGGSATGGVIQQNTAQEGRQNNNCANPNSSPVTAGGGQQESGCVNRDVSRNKHTVVKGGGARAEGGSATGGVIQQNTAQEGRQNNNCANPNASGVAAREGGRQESGCVNKDVSRNKHTVVKGGGARAEGGSGTVAAVQQNTAQEGRQHNNCANPNDSLITAREGGRQESGCVNKDVSRNKHTVVKGGGARAEGGSGTVAAVQQNTAQEGRQNNNCANPNSSRVDAIEGGRQESGCVNKDVSRNKHTVVKGGGARAEGGSATGGTLVQQNTAQEGRQNNNCANPNGSGVIASGQQESGCVNRDVSRNKHTVVKGGGARAEGGSTGAGDVFQQNTAQSGRQNNNCANPNTSDVTAGGGGRQESGCVNKDVSRNKHTVVRGGGARAEGGSATGGTLVQQNTAQEGRQNNNCANPNGSTITSTGSRAETRCKTIDHSKNIGTAEISDGAEAKGGSSALSLIQQNTAQEGRQNNNCGNPNNLTVTATGSGTQAQCVAVDRSTNIGSVHH